LLRTVLARRLTARSVHRDQVGIGNRPNIRLVQGPKCGRSTRSRDEFHFRVVGKVDFDDCAQIAGTKPVRRDIADQYDRFEQFVFHGSLGYPATSRGLSLPCSKIQTDTTLTARPRGPTKSPETEYSRPNSPSSAILASPFSAGLARAAMKDRQLSGPKPMPAKNSA
jgi:hypothetical protein